MIMTPVERLHISDLRGAEAPGHESEPQPSHLFD